MTKQTRRRLITSIVLAAAAGVLLVAILGPKSTTVLPDDTQQNAKVEASAVQPEKPETAQEVPIATAPKKDVRATSDDTAIAPFEELRMQQQKVYNAPLVLGALDDIDSWQMEVHFTQSGAGISSIQFSNIFETVDGKLAWHRYRKNGGKKPSLDQLYLLTTERSVHQELRPVLGAYQVSVNDQKLSLTAPQTWHVAERTENSVLFEATVIDSKNNVIAKVHRKWTLNNQYGLQLDQAVQNLTSQDVEVRWLQYGPSTLTVDRSRYMDRRRFRFGWELGDGFDPNHAAPIQSNDFYLEYTDATKEKETTIWPTEETLEEGFKLSWFASTNRYFSLAVFPNLNANGEGNRVFTNKVAEITSRVESVDADEFVLTGLWSPQTQVMGGDSYDLSMGIYAGPLQRSILDREQPYVALNMRDMVLYQMSSMCAICTFQWLADFLAVVLTTLDHYVVFDWGFAMLKLCLLTFLFQRVLLLHCMIIRYFHYFLVVFLCFLYHYKLFVGLCLL